MPGNLVSNGPYMLVARENQQYVELSRNPHYWNASQATIERVRYVPFTEEFAQFSAYRANQLDLTDIVPLSGRDVVMEQFPEQLHVRSAKNIFYYAFNLRAGPLESAQRLRQALSMTIRRDVLVSGVIGRGEVAAYSLIPQAFPDYDPPQLRWSDWSQERRDSEARNLLNDGTFAAEDLPTLRVLYNTNEGLRRITVAVTSMWREALNVETELTNQEFGVFLQTLRDSAAWDVARLNWAADFDDPYGFLEIFESNSPNNFVGFSDETYDDLLMRSHGARSLEARMVLLQEAEQRLLSSHAIAPTHFYVVSLLAKPWVGLGEREILSPLPTAELTLDPPEEQ